jgi:hypothetical protein
MLVSADKMKLKVRLDFCDCWQGFTKTNNFFYHLLQERFEIELRDHPDFIIYADPGQHLHRVHNCVKIFYALEADLPDFSECDYAFTSRYLDDPRHFRLPYYGTYRPKPLDKTNDDFGQIMASKTKFCSFLTGYANKKTRKRTDFFHKLSKYKKVDSAGRALNNVGFQVPSGPGPKVEFLKPYKFNIAFENACVPGYTTEKIVEAMYARALPIYWGNPRVDEEFNSRSFLNYFDFASEEELIEKIIELDQDDAKYMEYLRQPYFLPGSQNTFFDKTAILDHFEHIFTSKITPVSSRRRLFQFGRWIPVKKNRPH